MKVRLINLAHMDTMNVFIRHGAKAPSGPAPPHYRGSKITHSLTLSPWSWTFTV